MRMPVRLFLLPKGGMSQIREAGTSRLISGRGWEEANTNIVKSIIRKNKNAKTRDPQKFNPTKIKAYTIYTYEHEAIQNSTSENNIYRGAFGTQKQINHHSMM